MPDAAHRLTIHVTVQAPRPIPDRMRLPRRAPEGGALRLTGQARDDGCSFCLRSEPLAASNRLVVVSLSLELSSRIGSPLPLRRVRQEHPHLIHSENTSGIRVNETRGAPRELDRPPCFPKRSATADPQACRTNVFAAHVFCFQRRAPTSRAATRSPLGRNPSFVWWITSLTV